MIEAKNCVMIIGSGENAIRLACALASVGIVIAHARIASDHEEARICERIKGSLTVSGTMDVSFSDINWSLLHKLVGDRDRKPAAMQRKLRDYPTLRQGLRNPKIRSAGRQF